MTNNTNTKSTVDHDVFARTKLQLEAGLKIIAEIQKKIEFEQNAQKVVKKKENFSWEDYYANKEIFVRDYVKRYQPCDEKMCESEYRLRREGDKSLNKNKIKYKNKL